MSYFGTGYPRIQLRSGETVNNDYFLPYPTRRVFLPVLVNDPQINPVNDEYLERRFGIHFQFGFYWAILDTTNLTKIVDIVNEASDDIWLYPHHENEDLKFKVFVKEIELPLLAGKTANQGIELVLQTIELQTEITDGSVII